MNNAFSYILQNGAINSESIYPYEGKVNKNLEIKKVKFLKSNFLF